MKTGVALLKQAFPFQVSEVTIEQRDLKGYLKFCLPSHTIHRPQVKGKLDIGVASQKLTDQINLSYSQCICIAKG